MKLIYTIAAVAAMGVLLGSGESLGQDQCQSSGNHTIQVSEGSDGSPVLTYRGGSAETVHVCLGDTVQWVLNGPNRKYFVDFFNGGPIAGGRRLGSDGNVVRITIGGNAERGQGYDYNVEFDGGPILDPRIVVD